MNVKQKFDLRNSAIEYDYLEDLKVMQEPEIVLKKSCKRQTDLETKENRKRRNLSLESKGRRKQPNQSLKTKGKGRRSKIRKSKKC